MVREYNLVKKGGWNNNQHQYQQVKVEVPFHDEKFQDLQGIEELIGFLETGIEGIVPEKRILKKGAFFDVSEGLNSEVSLEYSFKSSAKADEVTVTLDYNAYHYGLPGISNGDFPTVDNFGGAVVIYLKRVELTIDTFLRKDLTNLEESRKEIDAIADKLEPFLEKYKDPEVEQ
ncbi:MAG: hypothetical protein WCV90_08360 [Candidatus Woesearchaeota archaeon]|jgi:hypothetical protein